MNGKQGSSVIPFSDTAIRALVVILRNRCRLLTQGNWNLNTEGRGKKTQTILLCRHLAKREKQLQLEHVERVLEEMLLES